MNKGQQHIVVLCEDDRNEQIANGFLQFPGIDQRFIQVFRPIGGWRRVVQDFEKSYLQSVMLNPFRHIVLIIDFDADENRIDHVKKSIPQNIADRVFVIGVRPDPEALKRELQGTYESIGVSLAKDCFEHTSTTWNHELLAHNAGEVQRMFKTIRHILFSRP